MSIFNLYPRITYKISDYDSLRAIDITTSVKIKQYLKGYRGIQYTPYIVKDGERPDYVAYKVYGDQSLDWIVLMSNDMYNIYEDWPMSSQRFEEYIIEKYGSLSEAQSTIKYYYDSDGNILDQTSHGQLPANEQGAIESVYQWEERKNINKSKIKLISPNIVPTIIADLKSLILKPIK